MEQISVCPPTPSDIPFLKATFTQRWGSSCIVSRGILHDATNLPAFSAKISAKPVGLITYSIEAGDCQIISLDSLIKAIGIGTALLEKVKEVGTNAGCRRLWLITTNDNLHALRFYQNRGFVLVAVYRNALEISRQLKPEIPLIGKNGIPLRDEIELEYTLSN